MPDAIEDLSGQAAAPELVTFANSPRDVQSIYVDTLMFATMVGTTVRLQFAEAIPGAKDSTDPGVKMRYTLNLLMPLDGFASTLAYLNAVQDGPGTSADAS